MHFPFYIMLYNDDLKLEIHHIPAINDLHTSTGTCTTTLSSAALLSGGGELANYYTTVRGLISIY